MRLCRTAYVPFVLLAIFLGGRSTGAQQHGPYPAFTLEMRGTDYDARGTLLGFSEWTLHQSSNGEWRHTWNAGDSVKAVFYRLGRGGYKSTSRTGYMIKGGDHPPPLPLKTAAQLRADPKFVRTEIVLGFITYVHHEELDGDISEDYLVAELGGQAIKRTHVGRPDQTRTIEEPVSLLLGEPAEADIHGPDYAVIEQSPRGNEEIAKLLLTKPDPVYPPKAITRRIEGSVSVQVTVDTEGHVVYASALSDIPYIDLAAEDAAYGATFAPTIVDGKPVVAFGTIHYEFALPPLPNKVTKRISDAQKQQFIQLLKTLPTCGDSNCSQAKTNSADLMPVLFALTEQDLERLDINPFAAISQQLANNKEHREYALHHFSEIRHPVVKAVFGARLFNDGSSPPEVVQFLSGVVEWTPVYKVLFKMMRPEFADFKRRVFNLP